MSITALARLAMVGAVLAAPLAALAQADSKAEDVHTVRYSYEKWSRTAPKRYLLVPQPATVKPGTLQERTRALFAELVNAKRNTYGDARLAFQPDAATTGVVYVYLDATKAPYHPITMAETVYTFTENGASKVVFPNVQADGWTRDDVPFPAYVLTLPLWQALPPTRMSGSLVSLPDGTLLGVEGALDKLQKGEKALVDAAWSYVKDGPAPAALAAVRAAPLLKFSDLAGRLLPVLESKDEALRGAALDGLDGLDDKKVNGALRKVMDSDPADALRDKAALLLSKSKDPNFAAAAQYHALRSKDPKVVAAAAEALGQVKAKEATEKLLGIVGHPDDAVRGAAVKALVARKEYKALVGGLEDQELAASVRLEVARALAATDDKKSQHAALIHLVTQGKGEDSEGAARQLAGFDEDATYAALGQAVKHPEAPTRTAAADTLAKLGKPAGLAALAKADIEDAQTGLQMTDAIRAIYGKQPLKFVLAGTKDSDAVLQRSAVAALGEMVSSGAAGKGDRKTIVKALDALSTAGDPLIRAAAARSYGLMPGKDVEANVKALMGDKTLPVKRAIATALAAYPGAETNTALLGFAKEEDARLKANALASLGKLKVQEALDQVVTHLNHDDDRVRLQATGALVAIGASLPDEKRKPMLSFFSERVFDKNADVRLKAVAGLELVNDPRTVTAMAALLQDPVVAVRTATLMAMAATGDASAMEPIATGLEDDDKTVRQATIQALLKLKQKAAAPLLKAYAEKEGDKALADAARKAAAQLGS
ncbi:MAG: HEAT repeat domain-containing protein [Myxococcales bacterium]|nr:HEAT repeat domain-containing protein [Myxococcales bacterium]